MNEREWEVLQQYDLQVRKISRFRGAFLCETPVGPYLLKESVASEERLQWEAWILEECRRRGHVQTETYVPNREEKLLSRSSNYRYYLLRTWREGQECDRDDREDLLLAAGTLAGLHLSFREMRGDLAAWEVVWRENWERIRAEEREAARIREAKRREENGARLLGDRDPYGSMISAVPSRPRMVPVSRTAEEMKKHTREMVRARNFIRKLRRKSELEIALLEAFEEYLPVAEEAERRMEILAPREDGLCHGDYACHHLFRGGRGVFVTDFGRLHHGVCFEDLYLLLRKSLENGGWNLPLAKEMLRRYDGVFPLSRKEYEYLYLRFLYPEKFWKQVNFYFNHRKSWMPARNLEKLRLIASQKEAKEKFLRGMEEDFL